MNKIILTQDFFIKDKKDIYYIKFKEYVNIYYLKLNVQNLNTNKIDDVINYIDNLPICDYIVKLDKYNTFEI